MRRSSLSLALLALSVTACGGRATPPHVARADQAAESPLVRESKALSPQAHAEAERLRAHALELHRAGNDEEANVVAEEAIAAYEVAIATARGVRTHLRKEKAEELVRKAEQELARLEERQRVALAESDAYELRARVALDTEPLRDVEKASPERLLARQRAALQLTSEARVLCLAVDLLDPKQKEQHAELRAELDGLDRDLSVSSVKVDLLPRATKARAGCLRALTDVRKPATRRAPETAEADRLLVALTQTNRLVAFRDDRGVVVNLRGLTTAKGDLTPEAAETLRLLAGTARENPNFPLLVVVHTAKSKQEKAASDLGAKVESALTSGGAPAVRLHVAGHAEPVVDRRVRGAEAENARVEIVFVSPRL